jgi:hypothetical protein
LRINVNGVEQTVDGDGDMLCFARRDPNPSDASIDATMKGNIRRCGTYPLVRAAISTRPDRVVHKINETGTMRDKSTFADKHIERASEYGMSRRAVLKVSVVGGGLLLGFCLPAPGAFCRQHSRKRLCAERLHSY